MTESKREKINYTFLLYFQLFSWEISDQLLQMKRDVETCYFAAQTMRTKVSSKALFTLFYSSNATHMPLLIELLTVLPEEVDSHSLRLGLNRREEFRVELGEAAPTVINLLTACSENYLNDQRLLGKIFKCLASWFYIRVCPSEEMSQSKIIVLLFELLKKSDTPSMLHEATSDCLCAALYSMEDVEEHLPLAKVLYQGINLLPEAYTMAVAEEDVDKCINYCRIFTELAEAFMEMMVETPNQAFGDLRTLDAVLTCVGHPQSEVAEITFNFWYRLSEIIYKRDSRELTDLYRPYIERLIHSLSVHCQIDTEHEGIPDESDDFGDFRVRVSELIKDVIFIVGSSSCFAQMFHNLASQQGASWEVTEAALFIMSSVAKNVLPDETTVVPQVMQAIISLPEGTHRAVRYTSTRILGELAEWIEKHPDYLDPVLNFLMTGLRDEELASVSGKSIQSICSTCQDHLQGHLECLLNIAQAVDAFNLSGESALGIIKGPGLLEDLSIRFKDVCKRDMKASEINPTNWEAYASDRPEWRRVVKTGVQRSEQRRVEQWEEKRQQQQQQRQQLATAPTAQPQMTFICSNCNRTCLSRIGLDETTVVPQVMQAIISLPEGTHRAVRYTSTRILGELAEWIEKHPDYLDPVLNFLMTGLRDEELASVSGKSIQSICSTCQDHLQGHLECLLNIAQAVDAFNLSGESALGIIKGTALVLARMPLRPYNDHPCLVYTQEDLPRTVGDRAPKVTRLTSGQSRVLQVPRGSPSACIASQRRSTLTPLSPSLEIFWYTYKEAINTLNECTTMF
eukprot:XP_011660665.1 PREDICTED: transportin-3 [Strongylocentrotus purpuratus]